MKSFGEKQMKLYYRSLEKGDLAKWEELAKPEFSEEDFCSRDYLLKRWNSTKGWVLMTPEKEWIGCCFISFKFHEYNRGGVHFLEWCIFPKFRSQGYAKHLVKLCFDNSIGFQKSICINPTNNASTALAQKYGFKELEIHKYWMVFMCDKDFYPQELVNLNISYCNE